MLEAANRVARFLLPNSLYESCRRRVVSHLIASYEARTVSHVFCGFPLHIALEDRVAAEWYDRDWPQSRELERLCLRPRELVFDLGAHQAIVAMVAGRLVGGGGRVIAVEAEPHNVRVARTNVALNGANNVEILHAAVTSQSGHVRFAEGLNGRLIEAGRVGTVDVPAVTVDGLSAEYGHPDAVLIDVEGAEVLALEGAAETIRRGARLMIEVHVGCGLEDLGGCPDDIARLLSGYRLEVSERDFEDGWHRYSPITTRFFLFAEPELPAAVRRTP